MEPSKFSNHEGWLAIGEPPPEFGLDWAPLKLIRPEILYFENARERFQREVEAVARLQHPSIVSIHSVGVRPVRLPH